MSNVRRYAPFVVPVVVLVVAVLLSPVHRAAAPAPAALPLSAGPLPPGVPATGGDRRHCAGARQYGDFPGAPPCEPTWVGRPNGGATTAGVTGSRIEVVDYHDADDAVINAATASLGAGIGGTHADNVRFMDAATAFINKKYELWNRTLHVDIYLGKCSQITPDPGCFTTEAKAITQKYHPFGVVYENDTDVPEFFDELSALKVVNVGGYGFPKAFDVAQRPFHYDVMMDGDTQADLAGSYWCRRLAGRRARLAGSADLRGQVRKAAIVVVSRPSGLAVARHLQTIVDRCDPRGAIVTPYSPDTTTAVNQAVAQITQFRRAHVTDVMWFSDALTPFFLLPQFTKQGYFPEHVLAGGQVMDNDVFGQLYALRAPEQWRHAFGPGDTLAATPLGTQPVGTIWRDAGFAGSPKVEDTLTWNYLAILAAGIQQAGPGLTPATFEHGVLTLPPTGGGTTGQALVKFGPGDYTAVSDAREVAWGPTTVSGGDHRVGSYRTLDGGRRFTPGNWPRGDPPL